MTQTPLSERWARTSCDWCTHCTARCKANTHTHTHSMLKMVTIFMSVMSPISHDSRCRPGHSVHTSLYTVSCQVRTCVLAVSRSLAVTAITTAVGVMMQSIGWSIQSAVYV